MSRFCFCNCPAGFSADPERHAPDCPGRSGAGKARTPAPATLTASQPVDSSVDFGIDGRSVRVSQEAYSIFLAREAAGREKIAALQQRLTAADERVDVLEGLLREVQVLITAEPFGVLSGMGDQGKRMAWYDKVSPVRDRIDAALKPAEPAKDEHVCTGCGSKGWTANCAECVPY